MTVAIIVSPSTRANHRSVYVVNFHPLGDITVLRSWPDRYLGTTRNCAFHNVMLIAQIILLRYSLPARDPACSLPTRAPACNEGHPHG